MKRNVIDLIIGICCCVICIRWYQEGYTNGYEAGRLDTLPSQSEIQEAIGVEVDGVIGKESRRVWDAIIEQREANKIMMPIMEKFNEEFDRVCLNGMEF